MEYVLRFDMKSVYVVQLPIPGFRHNRQGPPVSRFIRGAMFYSPGNRCIPYDTNAVRVRDEHRSLEESGFVNPGGSCHLPVAVEGEPAGEYVIHGILSARKDRCYTRSNGTHANLQFAFSGDQRSVPNLDAFHIGEGVQRSWSAVEWYAQIAGPWFPLPEAVAENPHEKDR